MTAAPSSRLIPIGAASLTVLLWAGSFLAISDGVKVMEPLPLAAARFFIAGCISAVWLATRRTRWPAASDLPRIALCGLIGIATYNALLGAGERHASASVASFIVATQPFFAGLLAWWFEGEIPGWRLPVGGAVAAIGVLLISLIGDIAGSLHNVVLLICAAACSGAYFVIQRPLVTQLGPLNAAACTMLTGGLWLLPWAPSGLTSTFDSHTALFAVLYLAVLASVAGYALWMIALQGLGATRAAIFLFLMAPMTAAMDLIGGRIAFSTQLLIGGALAIAGVVIASASRFLTHAANRG
ncbi:MAG: DMT family transporter [Sphingorhabdus sp.]